MRLPIVKLVLVLGVAGVTWARSQPYSYTVPPCPVDWSSSTTPRPCRQVITPSGYLPPDDNNTNNCIPCCVLYCPPTTTPSTTSTTISTTTSTTTTTTTLTPPIVDHHHHNSSDPLQWLRESVPGEPDVDYPILGWPIVDTDFSCAGRPDGYYADPQARCQVFHICLFDKDTKMLCPNGTIFSQEHFTCSWWNMVDCSTARSFYELNNEIGVVPVDSPYQVVKTPSGFHFVRACTLLA